MHRFFIKAEDVVNDREFRVGSSELLNQWRKVLRFEIGERIILLDGFGREYKGEITEITNREIIGAVHESSPVDRESRVAITLAQSLLKHADKFEWVLQKGTELGVVAFLPLITERTERTHPPKRERLEKILTEASEQSGRTVIPQLLEGRTYEEVVSSEQLVLIPHPDGEESFSAFKKKIGTCPREVTVCIGPEGGFSPEEIALARTQGAHVVSVGGRVLRSETAGIVLATLLNDWAEEF